MNTRSALALIAVVTGLQACGDDPADGDKPSPTVDAGAQDARTVAPDTGTDSGTKPVVDSGPPSASDTATLNALAGRYLLRFDNFGTTEASPGGLANFKVRSRVSMLVTAELTVDGGKLVATERFCDQTVLQRCEEGCTASTTVVDAKALSDFLVKRTFAREYTVSGTSFTAGHSVATLGYDETGTGAMPTSGTDTRVWDVVKGDPREGLLTQLTVTLPSPLPAISCKVYGVQKVDTAFAGTLQGTGASASFPTAAIVPDLSNSDGVTLGADNTLCSAQDVSSPLEKYNLRILRVGNAGGDTWSCPASSEFDTKLPGGAL
jgi:hypothetical protein